MVSLVFWLAFLALTGLLQPGITTNSEGIRDLGLMAEGVGWLRTDSRLVWTDNEGQDWRELNPIGGELVAADFISPQLGWVVAVDRAMAGDVLMMARTRDGGATWERSALSLEAPDQPELMASRFELDFTDGHRGILRVDLPSSSNFDRWSEWQTIDGGVTWEHLSSGGSHDPGLLLRVVRTPGAETLDSGYAWQRYDEGRCEASPGGRACRSASGIRVSPDGGRTWTELPLPVGVGGERQWVAAEPTAGAAAEGNRTTIVAGQGFDKCEIPTLQQLLDWRASSPYSAVNLYIGGSMAACSNRALSADYLRSLHSMGWAFIPTWVGPQSPCYGHGHMISTDPAVARIEGVAEANAAADTLLRLGLTREDGKGSIVYYDMEYYSTANETCNAAVRAFVTGWTQQLHSRGHLSGVYGTGSTLRLLANLPQPPNAIWAAHWIYSSYTPHASVWGVYGLPDGLWFNRQRLRQYTGGHNETWGATTLNIDSNVLDGIVAVIGSKSPILPGTARAYLPLILAR